MYCIFLIAITYFILLWESCWNTGRQYGTKNADFNLLHQGYRYHKCPPANVIIDTLNFMVKYNVNLNKYSAPGYMAILVLWCLFYKESKYVEKKIIFLLNNSWLLNIVVSSFCFSIVYYVFLVHAVVYIPLSGCCW